MRDSTRQMRDVAIAGARRLAVDTVLLRDELRAVETAAAAAVERARQSALHSASRALFLGVAAAVWRARARRVVGHSARSQLAMGAELRAVAELVRQRAEQSRSELAAAREQARRASPAEALLRAERAERRADTAERTAARAHADAAATVAAAVAAHSQAGSPGEVVEGERRLRRPRPRENEFSVTRSLPRALWRTPPRIAAAPILTTQSRATRPAAASTPALARTDAAPRARGQSCGSTTTIASGETRLSLGAIVPKVPPLPADATVETRRLWAAQQQLTTQLTALLETAADAQAEGSARRD
ncbi:hypothetical protein T492DRAFT_1062882 [Pavlovales sp. CCMP2436]|nr:hypothetical protein T492DRAFT_1062882 [Pavlovales sp. CCMP2436]